MSEVPGAMLRPRSGSSAKALLLTVLGELVLPQRGRGLDGHARRGPGPARRRGEERPAGDRPLGRRGPDSPGSGPDDRSAGSSPAGRGTSSPRARSASTPSARRRGHVGTRAGSWCCARCPRSSAPSATGWGPLGFAGFGFLSAGVAISPHLDRELWRSPMLERARPPEGRGGAPGRGRCRSPRRRAAPPGVGPRRSRPTGTAPSSRPRRAGVRSVARRTSPRW